MKSFECEVNQNLRLKRKISMQRDNFQNENHSSVCEMELIEHCIYFSPFLIIETVHKMQTFSKDWIDFVR